MLKPKEHFLWSPCSVIIYLNDTFQKIIIESELKVKWCICLAWPGLVQQHSTAWQGKFSGTEAQI